jgi:hypothetical protein
LLPSRCGLYGHWFEARNEGKELQWAVAFRSCRKGEYCETTFAFITKIPAGQSVQMCVPNDLQMTIYGDKLLRGYLGASVARWDEPLAPLRESQP